MNNKGCIAYTGEKHYYRKPRKTFIAYYPLIVQEIVQHGPMQRCDRHREISTANMSKGQDTLYCSRSTFNQR